MARVSINHGEKYVEGDIHTNTIEGFWSHLKRLRPANKLISVIV